MVWRQSLMRASPLSACSAGIFSWAVNGKISTRNRVVVVVFLSLLLGSYSARAAYLAPHHAANVEEIDAAILEFHLENVGIVAMITSDDNWKACLGADPDLSIAGCTVIITTGHIEAGKLGLAFFTRANTYQRKGDYEHAIEDY